jgi:alpha-mannosidase
MTDTVARGIDAHAGAERSPRIAARTLHAVGHFHLDPVWLWEKSDGLERFRATVRSVLELLARNPEMTIAASSAAMYDYLRRVDPEMFEAIVQRVREGRWEPVGGMWVEPDEHVPSGEAYVRQILLGQEFFARHFGRIARVAWSPDSFGRYGQLPRLLAGSGLEFFVFKRPERHLKPLPGDVFWWTCSDGSRVLASHLHEYGSWGTSLPRHAARVARDLREPLRHGLLLYGVGDHGGGPTQENIDQLHQLQHDPALPPIRFSTPEIYFQSLLDQEMELPAVLDNLEQFAGTGVSSHAALKSTFRSAENALLSAEAAISLQTGALKPDGSNLARSSGDRRRAWKRIAFNHFHDIAAGTSIPDAYAATFDELGEARAIARDEAIAATHAIAAALDLQGPEGTIAVAVFNLNGLRSRRFIAANVRAMELPGLPQDLTTTHVLIDEQDRELPMQRIDADAMPSDRVGFVADLPALGYRVFRLVPRPAEHTSAAQEYLPAGDSWIDNGRYRLSLDAETGCVGSLYDRLHGLEVFSAPAACPVLVEDSGNAWGGRAFNRPVGDARFIPVALARTQDGSLAAALRVEYELERAGVRTGSRLTQEFWLYRGLDYVDVRLSLLWQDRGIALKLAFPVFIKLYPELTTEIPYAAQMYAADGAQVPGLAWADATGESNFTERGEKLWHGVTIANSGRYSYSFEMPGQDRVVLSMLLARGNAFTYPPDSDSNVAFALEDEGVHRLSYRIVPHIGGWRESLSHLSALDLNRPPVVMAESLHPGSLPLSASVLAISHPNVVLGSLKPAEDGDGLIARFYEAHAEAAEEVEIALFDVIWKSDFRPHQIRTFRLRPGRVGAVIEVDLLERKAP